jgi:hypothetical protein
MADPPATYSSAEVLDRILSNIEREEGRALSMHSISASINLLYRVWLYVVHQNDGPAKAQTAELLWEALHTFGSATFSRNWRRGF